MHYSAVEPDQAHGARTGFIGEAHRAREVSRETFAAMDRTRNHDIPGVQQPSHEIYEYVRAVSVVGPCRVKTDIIRETARVERPLSKRNDKLGEITRKMLSCGCRPAI